MLEVGYSETDITPPTGAVMCCFPEGKNRQPRRAEGVHDPLKAKALALRFGRVTVCLCVCDLALWQNEDVVRVRQMASERCPDLPARHLVLAATHTHSSGENTYLFGGTSEDPWVQELRLKAAETVAAALENLGPADLSLAQVKAELNHNRLVVAQDGRATVHSEYAPGITEGVSDPALTVLRFDRTDGATLVWVHWAAHALTLGPGNRLFSADYPGAMAAVVELQRPGSHVLFTNGAAGNIHPRWCKRADTRALDLVGSLLAAKALEAVANATHVDVASLSLRTTSLSFPYRADSAMRAEAEISCLQLGPLTVGFLPGEPFIELQLALRRAVGTPWALLVGYANGWVGYIPDREAAAHGGFGVDFCHHDPPQYTRTMLPLGAAEQLLEALVELAG